MRSSVMRRLSWGLLLLASCSSPDPREDAVLFENAGERARRRVSTVYYFENANAVFSVVIPNAGDAEVHGEWSQAAMDTFSRVGAGTNRRFDQEGVVTAGQRDSLEEYFAGLPAGTSERTLSADPKPRPAVERKDFSRDTCIFYAETEGDRVPFAPAPARIRILHVSKTGETKTLRVLLAASKELPEDVTPGGEPLEPINWMMLRIASPRIELGRVRWLGR